MNSHRRGLLRGAVLAVTSSLALTACEFNVYDLPLPGGADVGKDSYAVTVYFKDVLDLVPQSSVKVDDVTVGKVESIELEGYTAEVVVRLKDSVKLPDNATASIRQTSLLGEKFVSLAAPAGATARGSLGDGEVIPLERSGRNTEIEEVLGALSLLLNGGGVAQLKTISQELSTALDGNEHSVKSVLTQLDSFMGQLDTHKQEIVEAIEALNRLAKSVKKQQGTIERTLDEMPAALDSIDGQRDDLVKMLEELSRLSTVGTKVIRQSKADTVSSLKSLAPVLTELADAGQKLPQSFEVLLTYPFVDATVGTSPAEARNLHMGDFVNLDVRLEVDLTEPLVAPGLPALPDLGNLLGADVPLEAPDAPSGQSGGGAAKPDSGSSPSTPSAPDSGCKLLVLCRTAPGFGGDDSVRSRAAAQGYDADIAAMLLQGVAR
ncbi:MAG: MCE family protein [Propionibacteriales bacterium]|nr:MCE family protein [Propionibacteriales bacterium]